MAVFPPAPQAARAPLSGPRREVALGGRVGLRCGVAAWVEGVFVYSNAGFKAIDLQRVEAPRWEHADLEIATCDMQAGL